MIYRLLLGITLLVIITLLLKNVPLKRLFLAMVQNAASVKLLFASKNESKKIKIDLNLSRLVLLNFSIVVFILLVLTSFIHVLFGVGLSGIFLVLHVTIAPFFVFVFTMTIVLWADKMKFTVAHVKAQLIIRLPALSMASILQNGIHRTTKLFQIRFQLTTSRTELKIKKRYLMILV